MSYSVTRSLVHFLSGGGGQEHFFHENANPSSRCVNMVRALPGSLLLHSQDWPVDVKWLKIVSRQVACCFSPGRSLLVKKTAIMVGTGKPFNHQDSRLMAAHSLVKVLNAVVDFHFPEFFCDFFSFSFVGNRR